MSKFDMSPELKTECRACGWSGKIKDLAVGNDRRIRCPKCGALAEEHTLIIVRRLAENGNKK